MTCSLFYFLCCYIIMAYLMYVAADWWKHYDKLSLNLYIVFSMIFAPIILPIVTIVGIVFKLVSKRNKVKIRRISYDIGRNEYDLFYYLEIINVAWREIVEKIECTCDWIVWKFCHYTCKYKIQLEIQNCHKGNIKPEFSWLRYDKPFRHYIVQTMSGYDKKTGEVYFGKDYSCYGGFFFKFRAKRFADKLRDKLSSENIMVKEVYEKDNDYADVNVKVIVPEWLF